MKKQKLAIFLKNEIVTYKNLSDLSEKILNTQMIIMRDQK